MIYQFDIIYYILAVVFFFTIELVVKVTGTAHDNDNFFVMFILPKMEIYIYFKWIYWPQTHPLTV